MTIGEKILNLRKARGWSQEELAERIGVTRQAVSRWESDSAKPDADKIVALCDLFGVSADYLLRDKITQSAAEEAMEAKIAVPKISRIDIVCWCAVAFSAVTMFLLKLFSSVYPKEIAPSAVEEVGGGVVSYSPGYYGFAGYIKYYDLEWLVWTAMALGILGAVVLLCRFLKKFWK